MLLLSCTPDAARSIQQRPLFRSHAPVPIGRHHSLSKSDPVANHNRVQSYSLAKRRKVQSRMSMRGGHPSMISVGLNEGEEFARALFGVPFVALACFCGLVVVEKLQLLLQGVTELPIKDITQEVFSPRGWQPIETNPYPDSYPFAEYDMQRSDEANDTVFYRNPRFVYHIDEGARAALTHYYQTSITTSSFDILDICSSWVSHYPKSFTRRAASIVGTGLNAEELESNKQLSSFVVRDLNTQPELPYSDSSFDIVTCVVSVDYLTSPLEVFKEVHRILKPGGRFIVSQSNRLFPTKAVNVWLRLGELNRLRLIGSYFHFAGGFTEPKAFDISAQGSKPKRDPEPWESAREPFDPMYIVEATKLS